MLRTLLHELLKQAEPEMTASIAPESLEALCLFDEDPRPYWEDLLHSMLSRAFEHMSKYYKICIFIDGLDELKGKHGDLVKFFRDAMRAHPIKLCISSRPWQVFQDAFQDKPCLKLEDLTLADITAYVQSHLHPDPAFALLRTLEPSFSEDLVSNIAAKPMEYSYGSILLWLPCRRASRLGIVYQTYKGDSISSHEIWRDCTSECSMTWIPNTWTTPFSISN